MLISAIPGANMSNPAFTRDEGFDELYYVRINENDDFVVEDWKDEV